MLNAPKANKRPHKITQHGEERIDNYHWMRLSDAQKMAETPDAQTQEVLAYLQAENEYTAQKMVPFQDLQEEIYQEMIGRLPQREESVPYQMGGYTYGQRFEEGQEYPIYYRIKAGQTEEEILLDLNALAADKAFFQLASLKVSPNGQQLAYTFDDSGRRIYKMAFIDLQTKTTSPIVLQGCSGDIAWASDNEHLFFTTRNPETLLSEKVYRYRLGQSQEEAVLVYEEEDKSFYTGVYRSRCQQYIIIWNSSTLSSDYQLLEADQPLGQFWNFMPRQANHEYSIGADGQGGFYILSNQDAPNFKLLHSSKENTAQQANWTLILPHRPAVFLEDLTVFKDFYVLEERKAGQTHLRLITADKDEYLPFEEEVYMVSLGQNHHFEERNFRYIYGSMTTPNSVYAYHLEDGRKELLKQQEVVGGHNPADYQTERLWVEARDGAKVPVSLVYKKGFKKDGKSPLLLYAYGAYGHTIDPYFSSSRLSLLDRGFAFAIAHIRGGQALGRDWFEQGRVFNKKNSFYDFIDVAQSLCLQQYSSAEKLFGMGGSAGGLLMGAVANMAPTAFRGLVAAVPFVDVLNTMSDASIPLTTNEYDQWGNPEEEEAYRYILSYSPYENVQAQYYCAILVTTGYHDSQVQYWEPAKWVAELRDKKLDQNTLLLHTNLEAGHGGASGRFQAYKELALEYAFLFACLAEDEA
ncbi:S9 family peptidase [Saprospira sp. CCB-QB6]|uniref:S9 family peptidase n=1 Tax=Saprospira sp. CCB-QB6 TaxID=3023936 RepID=UPI00234A1CD3|nr:S9 family peptidase [Saprospira sp. CCB-QB6]WCL81080.1 S9 family peptidase [Saprospira sp. CCB-QB6]